MKLGKAFVLGALTVSAVSLLGVAYLSVSRGPRAEVGRNSAGIRWISYEEAHAKPIVDMHLGSFHLQLPKNYSGLPPGGPNEIAGYLVIPPTHDAQLTLPNGDVLLAQRRGYIAVPWASAESRRASDLIFYDTAMVALTGSSRALQSVIVKAPFLPGKGASRYEAVHERIGAFRFSGFIDRFNHQDGAFLLGNLIGPPLKDGRIASEYGDSSMVANIFDNNAVLVGQRLPNGDVEFKGAIASKTLKRTPFSFVVKPSR